MTEDTKYQIDRSDIDNENHAARSEHSSTFCTSNRNVRYRCTRATERSEWRYNQYRTVQYLVTPPPSIRVFDDARTQRKLTKTIFSEDGRWMRINLDRWLISPRIWALPEIETKQIYRQRSWWTDDSLFQSLVNAMLSVVDATRASSHKYWAWMERLQS